MFESSDPMRLDSVNENSDDEDFYDSRLNKLVLTFIRLKQMNQFAKNFDNNNNTKYGPKRLKKSQLKAEDDDLMDFEESNTQQAQQFMCHVIEKSSWLTVWNKIESDQNELKRENIEEYLKNNTTILSLHLKHAISLDSKCFSLLVGCIEPKVMEEVFDKCLIDPNDSIFLSGLFERQKLFNNLQLGLYNVRSHEPCKILASLTVLLYKTKCTRDRQKICELMIKKLSVFINREQYHKKFRLVLMKHFLNSVYLNGLLTYANLNDFLSNAERSFTNTIRNDRDTDSDASEDDEDDESGDDDDSDRHGGTSDSSDESENERPNNNQNEQAKTVGKLINIPKADEYKSSFPLSLKNLCRVAVKNSLVEYTTNSVKKLTILPNVIKNFVMFREEIDNVIKVCGDVDADEQPQSQQRNRIVLNDLRVFV